MNGDTIQYESNKDLISVEYRGIYGNGVNNLFVRTPPHGENTSELVLPVTWTASFLVKILAVPSVIYSKVDSLGEKCFIITVEEVTG